MRMPTKSGNPRCCNIGANASYGADDMRLLTLVICGLAVFVIGFGNAAAQEKGDAEMILSGGERGDVPFNHKQHQDNLKDCNTCHSLFPQKFNGISEMIEQGNLTPKKVMNTLCTGCHREKKKAGEATGPVTCSKCHIK